MSFIEELKWRGMLQDVTPGLEEQLASGMCTAYIGFDPTAPSLTIGNYVQIMLLRQFQLHGHKPIFLLGGATGRIGDPSGKDKERELKTYDELDKNLAFQQEQASKFLDFDCGDNSALFLNNFDFYKNVNVLDFLRDVGKNLTVNYMLGKESVKKRLDSGLSFTEFSYQLLQANDFLELYREHNCIIQMGGSDQWGNITSGTEFIRRNVENGKAYALTTPLLTKADGSKFGKSEGGNIWLDPAMTSPYKFYQFWINAADADLAKYYRYFSFKSKEEIEGLEAEYETNPNALKKILAEELTTRIHSQEDYESAMKVSEIVFNHKASPESLSTMSETELSLIAEELPSVSISKAKLSEGIALDDLLTETEILKSKGDVRRAIKNNAISINKVKIQAHNFTVDNQHLLQEKYCMIENGKKNKYILILN
jgi:tyrosyl-tRNA synthetase